jgi:hypothetical protein
MGYFYQHNPHLLFLVLTSVVGEKSTKLLTIYNLILRFYDNHKEADAGLSSLLGDE